MSLITVDTVLGGFTYSEEWSAFWHDFLKSEASGRGDLQKTFPEQRIIPTGLGESRSGYAPRRDGFELFGLEFAQPLRL